MQLWACTARRSTDLIRNGGDKHRSTVNIGQIQIGFRYRKGLGDLPPLADSIAEVGLLHPVVVSPEGA